MERSRGDSVPSNGNIKISGLWKRAQCLSKFTKPNYKHRVFILTDQALSYYCGTVDRVGQLKGRVDLETVRAVEFVDESAFNLTHTLQVVYFRKKYGFVTLYITATDKRECADWTACLRQACYFNQDMLMHYHPGALLKGKWSCCQQRSKTSLGCQPTYHLLTRSSSRYAQMRRRDTLSSSHGHRRSKTARQSFEDRRSVASGTHNDVEAAGVQVQGRTGAGLSNSCIDLTQHPPHKLDTFAQDIPPSRRSSRQSTEPSGSVGIDCITLTQVSLVDTGVLDAGSEEMESGASSEPKEGETQGPSRDESRSSRYQVAPETSHFPIRSLRLLEPEQKTVPHTRLRGKSLGNVSFPGSQREGSPPPFPSRYRNSVPTTSASFHGIISIIPSVTRIRENQEPSASRMKHSQTFVATSSIVPTAQHCKLSSSMSALCQPLISPRISHTDPNIIHV